MGYLFSTNTLQILHTAFNINTDIDINKQQDREQSTLDYLVTVKSRSKKCEVLCNIICTCFLLYCILPPATLKRTPTALETRDLNLATRGTRIPLR